MIAHNSICTHRYVYDPAANRLAMTHVAHNTAQNWNTENGLC